MKRILICSNTYYQLLMAIQMKLTLFCSDYVHVLLSDNSNNAELVYEALKSLNLFDNISFVKSKGLIQKRGRFSKLREVYDISFGKRGIFGYYLDGIDNLSFDEMISYNYEIDTFAIYSILAEHSDSIVYSSYEEGMLAYENINYESLKFNLICFIRKLFGKQSLKDGYKCFYCSYPELYDGMLEAVKIPDIRLEDGRIGEICARIFNIRNAIDYSKYKCIFFESIYETEDRSIGEIDILRKLVMKIGKDNILVKKHPRSKITIYEEMGLAIDENSAAPFEAIQLNNDLSDCVFVAAASGSVLSINSMLDRPSKVSLFFPLTNYKQYSDIDKYFSHIESIVNTMKNKGELKHVRIIDNLEDVFW